MKKYLSVIVLFFLITNIGLKAEDLLPSDAYYKDHIAVNEISTKSPSLKNPGSGIPDPGGEGEGAGPPVGGSVGDALYPFLFASLGYGLFSFYRKRSKLNA